MNCAKSPIGKTDLHQGWWCAPYYDTALAVKAGADVVVLDGMQGGTAATQDVFIENVGMPTLACIRPAVQALQDLGMHRKVQLVVSGGIRSVRMSPRLWRLVPMRLPSERRRWWRWAITTRNGKMNTRS